MPIFLVQATVHSYHANTSSGNGVKTVSTNALTGICRPHRPIYRSKSCKVVEKFSSKRFKEN